MHRRRAAFRLLVLSVNLLAASAWNRTTAAADDVGLARKDAPHNVPPAGFAALFNGHDLSGWHGLGQIDPAKFKKMSPRQREKMLAADEADMRKHWRVEGGEIVNDGRGVFLTTDKDYSDFELWLEWRMVAHNGDSGIYLRGYPQVQIWDPANSHEKRNGADKGSGGLWNDNPDNPGRFPLVKADQPVGQWNSLRIRMVGPRVTVYLNGPMVVDNAVLDNFFDRQSQVLSTGPIQLQTHGSEMRFRNIYLRDLPAEK